MNSPQEICLEYILPDTGFWHGGKQHKNAPSKAQEELKAKVMPLITAFVNVPQGEHMHLCLYANDRLDFCTCDHGKKLRADIESGRAEVVQ